MFDYDLDKIEVRSLTCGQMEVNSYIVINNGECLVIDPGEYTALNSYLECLELKCKAVLLTHGHYDHITGAAAFQKRGIPVYIHAADAAKCNGDEMGDYLVRNFVTSFKPDVLLTDNQILDLIGLKIKVLHTPGHSKGGVCYLIENCIFSGDTLFKSSYGRYDFYDGSLEQIKQSIAKLFALGGDYKVYPGHGRPTQLDIERQSNMILWS